jgi:intraflagellar transport protein 74
MPDQEAFAKNREDATFKERQLESSQATMERLRGEREQRSGELEKVQNLDEKIKVELASLSGKMVAMRGEMGAFDDLDGLREGAQSSKAWLQTTIEQYKARKQSSREQVSGLRRRYEEVRRELADNETYKALEGQEGRLRKYAQTIFLLNEFVETKGRETEYESLKGGCLGMAGRLNGLAKEAMLQQAQNLSDAPLSGASAFGGGY